MQPQDVNPEEFESIFGSTEEYPHIGEIFLVPTSSVDIQFEEFPNFGQKFGEGCNILLRLVDCSRNLPVDFFPSH